MDHFIVALLQAIAFCLLSLAILLSV